MKSLAVLGSTGSIGTSTLKIVRKFPDDYKIKVLAAKQRVESLAEQVKMFLPEMAVVYDLAAVDRLKQLLPKDIKTEILFGPSAYEEAAAMPGVDMVVGAMVGAAGLAPILAAIEAGKDIALANKETLVMAGEIVTRAVKEKGVQLLPVDSEHSAIFQCLQGEHRAAVDKLIITASGGPFFKTPESLFASITPEQALKHPNWQMGAKITIDSATLMNKGLEVIEAKWLFQMPSEKIEVLVHPQSIIHSMVAFRDGSVMAQMGIPDMQQAIAYALSYPDRLALRQPLPDLAKLGALTFAPPDFERFPCLALAFEACNRGGTLPTVLNAANEVAVAAFLDHKISFPAIPRLIEETMADHSVNPSTELEQVLAADAWARETAQSKLEQLART